MNKTDTLTMSTIPNKQSSSSSPSSPAISDDVFDVVVVGAGVAGCSAAYHLVTQTTNNHNATNNHKLDHLLIIDAADHAGQGVAPRYSGSATMPSTVAPCVKMMVQLFAGNCDEFVRHHGTIGAQRYLRSTRQGIVWQKGIAQELLEQVGEESSPSQQNMKELGSYYVAYQEDETALQREFELLKSFGCGDDQIEWCDKERLASVQGLPSSDDDNDSTGRSFHCGIYFPKDAIIDSSWYAKSLLNYTLHCHKDKAQFWPHTRLQHIQESAKSLYATLTLENKQGELQQIRAKQVVMATGGFYQDPTLHGILKPCYSYLVNVPVESPTSTESSKVNHDNGAVQDSANFFTWGFTHDWCFTNGKIRCSGEDHFSAYKDPHVVERCQRLSQWTLEQYGCYHDGSTTTIDDEEFWAKIPQQYGIYTETPDMVPLIGHHINNNNHDDDHSSSSNSRVCYLVGCNAWGQAVLSYCSSLVPGLLKYRELTSEEKDCLKLFTIRRFSHLPSSGRGVQVAS